MRTSIIGFAVSGLMALSVAACSGASTEPTDQSAEAERAGLATPTPSASGSAAPGADGSARFAAGEGRKHRHAPRDPSEFVKRFDKNADGKLEVSELPEHMQRFVSKADANNDGVLSVDELEAGREKMRAEHLAKVDTDHDGTVSPEERKAAFEQFAEKRFAKMDKNNDGALSKDEVGDERWEHLSVADSDKNGSVTETEIKQAVAAGVLKFPHHRHGFGGSRDWQPRGPDGDGNETPAPKQAPAAPSGA